jgi:SAM-dependent methyltransferase
MTNRWQRTDAPRGTDYDARWRSLEEAGENIHGEADLVEALLAESGATRVLDAGCGTGRVAIELASRGLAVIGIDADTSMLSSARTKAPEITWCEADLSDPAGIPAGPFDLVLLAGNVMIFVEPGTEGEVVANLVGVLAPGGLLVAGFSLQPDQLTVQHYDQFTAAVGLASVARWSTWDRRPFADGDYAVSVHRRERSR